MKFLFKMLKQHVNCSQLIGFLCANIIGLFIVLLAVQFYQDVKPLINNGGIAKQKNIVISKKVNVINSLAGSNLSFSDNEINEIEKQNFVLSVDQFISSQFEVYVDMSILGTNLFFESVPEKYLDVQLDNWTFDTSLLEIPIIIPRTYLNLYNFGLAPSMGIPKLSEGSIKSLPLNVKIKGIMGWENFKGKIVGFSNTINTILVPEQFLVWANKKMGNNPTPHANRLIVATSPGLEEKAQLFFADKGYEIEGGALDDGKTVYFMRFIINIVLAIGLIISILSFYILILSITLLLQKNSEKIENLYLIAYSNCQIAQPYYLLALLLNSFTSIIVLIIVYLVRPHYYVYLKEVFPQLTYNFPTVLLIVTGSIFVIMNIINYYAINKKIRGITRTR